MNFIINFYHTEAQYRAGIVVFKLERKGSREAVIAEAKNLSKVRGDYMYEVVPA